MRPVKQIGNQVVAQPALSVNIFPLTNSSLVNNKNIIEFEIMLKMVRFIIFFDSHDFILINFLLKSNRIEAKSLKCAHWRFDRAFNDGFWSNDGCKYIHYDASNDFHKCVCNYTTHFALLFVNRLNLILFKSFHKKKLIANFFFLITKEPQSEL